MVTPARSVPDAQSHRFIKYQSEENITCSFFSEIHLRITTGKLSAQVFLARSPLLGSRQSWSCDEMHNSQSVR